MTTTELAKDWLVQFEYCVSTENYSAARVLFKPDVLAFGTTADVCRGLDELEQNQWRKNWPRYKGFLFDYDTLTVRGDKDFVLVFINWRTASPNTRKGRATIGLQWGFTRPHYRCLHTHFSIAPVETIVV